MSYNASADPTVLTITGSGAAASIPTTNISRSGVDIVNIGPNGDGTGADIFVALQPLGNTALTNAQILAGQWTYKVPAGYTCPTGARANTQVNVACASASKCSYQDVL